MSPPDGGDDSRWGFPFSSYCSVITSNILEWLVGCKGEMWGGGINGTCFHGTCTELYS
jgi:hypothetical protein